MPPKGSSADIYGGRGLRGLRGLRGGGGGSRISRARPARGSTTTTSTPNSGSRRGNILGQSNNLGATFGYPDLSAGSIY